MRYSAILLFALRRLRSRLGLTLFSLLGITVTVAVVASIPVFLDAVGLELLRVELDRYAFGNQNPPVAMRIYRVPSAPERMTVDEALSAGDWLANTVSRAVGLPIARRYTQLGSHAFWLRPAPGSGRYATQDLAQVRVNCVVDIDAHITILDGMSLAAADTSDVLLVWALPEMTDRLGLQIGEEFELYSPRALDPQSPTRCRFAGVWQANDPQEGFWYRDPRDLMGSELLTSMDAFRRYVEPSMYEGTDFSFWYVVLDEKRLRFDRVDAYEAGTREAEERAMLTLPSVKVDRSPIEPLMQVQRRVSVLKVLLLGFSLPVVALLLVFVGAISVIAVGHQRAQVAVLMSRGASRLQVLAIGLAEGLFLALLATPLGIGLAGLLAQAMSLNSGFLTFDRPQPLAPAMQAVDWRLVSAVLAISLLVRMAPAIRQARYGLIAYEQERAGRSRGLPVWRLLFTLLLVPLTYYAYQRLVLRGTMGVIDWEPGTFGGALSDPLVFLAPTLFVFCTAWCAAQLFPLIMRLPDLVGRLLPSPALYLGLRDLSRESGPYVMPLFVVAACLCLGALEASIARSAKQWMEDRWHYQVGADYTFGLGVASQDGIVVGQDAWLMPAESFLELPSVTDATRVGHYRVIADVSAWRVQPQIMGIDVDGFQRVAYFREDYAPQSLGAMLNLLRATPNGILVAQEFLDARYLNVWDTVTLRVSMEENFAEIPFVIVGVFDFFPTIYDKGGGTVVGNLTFIHETFGGIGPFDVWLRTRGPMDVVTFLDAAAELGIVPINRMDGRALVAEDEQRMERVGIFGNLSVGFMATSLLACLGLMVYASASLAARVRRLTILRALGLSVRQVLAMLSVEYALVILYGVVLGALSGVVCARLFGQFFQFTDDPALQVPPFLPQVAMNEIAIMALAYLLVLVVAEVGVIWRLTRRQAFQALRLGGE